MDDIDPAEVARRRALGDDWIRIRKATDEDSDLRALYLEYMRQYPSPTHSQALLIRREMLAAMEEMNV